MKSFFQMLQILKESSGSSSNIVADVRSYIDQEFAKIPESKKESLYYFIRELTDKFIDEFDKSDIILNTIEEIIFYDRLIIEIAHYMGENEINREPADIARRGMIRFICYYGKSLSGLEEIDKVLDIPRVIYQNECNRVDFDKVINLVVKLREFSTRQGYRHGTNWEKLFDDLTSPRDESNESIQDDFMITLGVAGFIEFANQYRKLSNAAKVGVDRPRDYTERFKDTFAPENTDYPFEESFSPEYIQIIKKYIPVTFSDHKHIRLLGEFESFGPYNPNDTHPAEKTHGYDEEWLRHMQNHNYPFGQNLTRDDIFFCDLVILSMRICKKRDLVERFQSILNKIMTDDEFQEEAVRTWDLPLSQEEKNILGVFFVSAKKLVRLIIKELFKLELIHILHAPKGSFPKNSNEFKIKKIALSISKNKREFFEMGEKMQELTDACIDEGLLNYSIVSDFLRRVPSMDVVCQGINTILERAGIA